MSIYIGNGVARNVTDIYVGINGIARKVTDGYVGVNGIARRFYGSGGGGGYPQLIHYTMLYDYGDECNDITGGWDGHISSTVSYYSGVKTSLTKNSDNMVNPTSIAFRAWSSRVSNNTIDYTGYTYIGGCFQSSGFGTHSQFRFILNNSATQDKEAQTNVVALYVPTKNQGGIYTDKTIMTQQITTYASGCYATMNVVGSGSPSGGYGYIYTMFMLKDDDWQTLASKAGITASNISDLLSQSSTLLSVEDAVNFMVKQCTGNFMVDAINNSIFMTALSQSQYISLVYDNIHWNKFLTMKQ